MFVYWKHVDLVAVFRLFQNVNIVANNKIRHFDAKNYVTVKKVAIFTIFLWEIWKIPENVLKGNATSLSNMIILQFILYDIINAKRRIF